MLPFLRNGRRLYAWLLAALVETAVAIPWVIFTYSIQSDRRWPEALPGVWLLLLAYLAAALWEGGAPSAPGTGGKARGGAGRLIAMAVGLIGIYALAYAVMPPALRPGSLLAPNLALSVIPVAGYLWYQGARSGAEGIYYARVFDRFIWQGAALVGGIVMLYLAGSAAAPQVQVLLIWSVPLFFASDLMLLVVTRERALRTSQARNGDPETGGAVGSPATTGLIAGLLALTLAASSLLSMERLARVGGAIWRVIDQPLSWLTDALMLIVYRWILLVWLVVGPLLAHILRTPPPKPPGQQADPGEMAEQLRQLAHPDRVWHIDAYLKAALIVAVLVALAFALFRLNRRDRQDAGLEEERISLGFWANLMADLRGLFARSAAAIAVGTGAATTDTLDPRDPRALYRRLQAWGANSGRPRRPGETPTAYQGALAEQQPGAAPAVASVTALYNQARYGAAPPASEAVAEAAREVAALEERESGAK